MLTQLLFRKSR